MPITSGNHPAALWPGVYDWWGAKYDEHKVEYTDLFDMKGSQKAYEEIVQQTGFGLAPVKSEGSAVTYADQLQGYTTRSTHVAYALGYIVTKEELDDNLYQAVSMQRAESLAFSMRQTKENVAANVYNRAANSNYTYGDGVELFSSAHPDSIGGTFANELTVAANLSEAALEDSCIQIMKATNPKGLKISLQPQKLIVPSDLVFEATRILKSTLQNDSANNAVNALRSLGAIPEIAANHYLSSATAWFVRTNAPGGMCGFDRRKAEFTKDNDFDTENAKAKAYERYSFTVPDPRAVYGSEGV